MISTIEKHNIDFLMLNNIKNKKLSNFNSDYSFLIENFSLDKPSIWKLSKLQHFLKPGENLTNFEKRVTLSMHKKLPCVNINFLVNILNNGVISYQGNIINSYYRTKNNA